MNNEVIETISKVQKYIENNLLIKITLSELAKVANYSIPQLERLFRAALALSPFQYIRKMRLTAAARVLRDNEVRVIDTAIDFLFDSHEGFTRAFTREFGISPFAYKKNPLPIKYYVSYNVIDQKSFNKIKENEYMESIAIFTQIVERAKRKAIIKRGVSAADYFSYCEEVDCDVWGMLISVKEAQFEPAGFWLPKEMIKPGTSEYVQGVEVPTNYSGVIPEGFELIELPACKYMIFNSEEYDDQIFEEVIIATWKAIDKYNPVIYGYEWDDAQPRFQLEPRGERGYIEARPIKAIKR